MIEITELKVGMSSVAEDIVTEDKLANAMGSGSLAVYATPAMTCLMEKAAAELAQRCLPDGWTSVGISLRVAHKAPTPPGMKVRAEARVTAIDGRKISYEVHAFDETEEIGSGTHERFAVPSEKFRQKAEAKGKGHIRIP